MHYFSNHIIEIHIKDDKVEIKQCFFKLNVLVEDINQLYNIPICNPSICNKMAPAFNSQYNSILFKCKNHYR